MTDKIILPDPFEFDEDEYVTQTYVQLDMGSAGHTKTIDTIFHNASVDNRQSLLQQWTNQFLQKQRDYGDSADDLGAPGQYAELHRKMGKLRRALWEGKPLVGEPAREVLMDLVGHCFLAIKHLDENNHGGKAG